MKIIDERKTQEKPQQQQRQQQQNKTTTLPPQKKNKTNQQAKSFTFQGTTKFSKLNLKNYRAKCLQDSDYFTARNIFCLGFTRSGMRLQRFNGSVNVK